MNKNKTKSEVCKLAWMLYKQAQGKIFTDIIIDMSWCMKKAWMAVKLKQAMRNRIVPFSYWKKDGTQRHAHGTLIGALLPETKHTGKTSRNPVITYFDTDQKQWRSCLPENLINIG